MSEAESHFFPRFSLANEAEVDAAFRLITERTDRRSLVGRLEDVLRQRGIVPGRSPVMACGTGGFAVVAMNALLLESLTPSRGVADYLPRIHRLAAAEDAVSRSPGPDGPAPPSYRANRAAVGGQPATAGDS